MLLLGPGYQSMHKEWVSGGIRHSLLDMTVEGGSNWPSTGAGQGKCFCLPLGQLNYVRWTHFGPSRSGQRGRQLGPSHLRLSSTSTATSHNSNPQTIKVLAHHV